MDKIRSKVPNWVDGTAHLKPKKDSFKVKQKSGRVKVDAKINW